MALWRVLRPAGSDHGRVPSHPGRSGEGWRAAELDTHVGERQGGDGLL